MADIHPSQAGGLDALIAELLAVADSYKVTLLDNGMLSVDAVKGPDTNVSRELLGRAATALSEVSRERDEARGDLSGAFQQNAYAAVHALARAEDADAEAADLRAQIAGVEADLAGTQTALSEMTEELQAVCERHGALGGDRRTRFVGAKLDEYRAHLEAEKARADALSAKLSEAEKAVAQRNVDIAFLLGDVDEIMEETGAVHNEADAFIYSEILKDLKARLESARTAPNGSGT